MSCRNMPSVPLSELIEMIRLPNGRLLPSAYSFAISSTCVQTPPVIHRDIKPQNIVMDEQGEIKLIDFEFPAYDETASRDTVFSARWVAPPEQYGFAQTDGRADISPWAWYCAGC